MGLIVGSVVLASGRSARFGKNKLLIPFGEQPLIARALNAAPEDMPRVAVTRWEDVALICRARGFETIVHAFPDISDSVRLGARRALDWDGAIFLVGDQPLIQRETLMRMREAFAQNPSLIVRAAHAGRPGNPALFPRDLLEELCRLPQGKGGSFVAARYPDRQYLIEVDPIQLMDADTPKDMEVLRGLLTERKENTMFTHKNPPMPDTVCVATVFNAIQSTMLRDILENAGIPSLIRPKYGLDPLPVLAGSSMLGEEIYVDASQAEEARQLLAAFTDGSYKEEEPQP